MPKRTVTNEDIEKYTPLVTHWIKKAVLKNWNEATLNESQDEVSIGNTGMSMRDIRQYFMTELVVALQNYDPEYRDKKGNPVKELTFVYNHFFYRAGQLMKKKTRKAAGYGVWMTPIDVSQEDSEESSSSNSYCMYESGDSSEFDLIDAKIDNELLAEQLFTEEEVQQFSELMENNFYGTLSGSVDEESQARMVSMNDKLKHYIDRLEKE